MKAFGFLLIVALLGLLLVSVSSMQKNYNWEMLRVKNVIRLEQEAEETRFGMEEAFEKAIRKGLLIGRDSEHPEAFVCAALKSLGFNVRAGYLKGYDVDEALTKTVVIEQSAEKWLTEGFPDLLPLIDDCVKFVKYEDGCVRIGVNTNYAFEEPLFSLGRTGFVLREEREFGEVRVLVPEGRVFCERTSHA